MTASLPEHFERAPEQPIEVDFQTIDQVFIKQILIPKAGTFVPQHSHAYEHATMLALGSVRVYLDGKYDSEYKAPICLTIKAGVKHLFEALEDRTILYCVHNLSRKEIVEILDEHHLVD